jgi:hypothetical protein
VTPQTTPPTPIPSRLRARPQLARGAVQDHRGAGHRKPVHVNVGAGASPGWYGEQQVV